MARTLQDHVVSLIRGISDWSSPDLTQFSVLHYLHRVQVDFALLKAVATAWDTDNHVFNFGGHELYPLPEEFSTILGLYFSPSTRLVLSFFQS